MCVSAIATLIITGCGERDLRGRIERSKDGRTYLVVADDNGAQCGPMFVDRLQWPQPIGVAGPIAPGDHFIACGSGGGATGFHIDAGKTYYFDYWGP
jgi:hypothetical protein